MNPATGLVALAFSDPAYEGTASQVTDVWILNTKSLDLEHVPGFPAAVALKETSMSWTDDGRLIVLARSGGRELVAAWRPGQVDLPLRRVRLPRRNSGSDAFVAR